MKAIMISIQPQWVAKILNGEKTIEIRKTRPKCELPCKVYIYCSKHGRPLVFGSHCPYYVEDRYVQIFNISKENADKWFGNLQGKIVGEFILEEVESLWQNHKDGASTACIVDKQIFERLSCMTWEQYCEYHRCKNGKNSNSYAWHIDDLKIYDEPKELGEFRKPSMEECCENCKYNRNITHPPQSWFYCEELEENDG